MQWADGIEYTGILQLYLPVIDEGAFNNNED